MQKSNILPADTYTVVNKSIINAEDRLILNMLYQPIVGPLAIMLYFSLWTDLDKSQIMSIEYAHHHLVTNMHLTLDEIVEAREKLEAIGLLKSYFKESNINNYLYELYSPLNAHDFFNHPILNIVLYNNVGKKEYEKLINYFKIPKINTTGYLDITKSFSEVFTPVPLTSYQAINDNIRKYNKLKLNIDTNFDFNFLIESLPKNLDKEKILTKENRQLILELSFLYDLDALKIQDIIKTCITERGTLNKEEFRKTCRNYYKFDNKGALPSVIYNSQPEYLKTPIGENSKRAKMIYTFETISPYELLKSKNNGGEPTSRDIRLAEDLILDYGLRPGVVNVLIDYILKINNNKLTRAYAETIAGQWKRQKIETVEEAMNTAEKEHKKYKKSNSTKTTTKIKKEEIIPDWFDKEIKKKTATEEQKNEMEDFLKEYR